MQLLAIQRILGLLLSVFSLTMVPPIAVSAVYDDGAIGDFVWAMVIILVTGLALWWPVRRAQRSREPIGAEAAARGAARVPFAVPSVRVSCPAIRHAFRCPPPPS